MKRLVRFFYTIFTIALLYSFYFYYTPESFYTSPLYVKSFHIIFIICWMAGLLYLPRLYVYHSGVEIKTKQSELFKIMEKRLLYAIMTPAMILSWLSGLWLAYYMYGFQGGWLHIKIFVVLLLSGYQGFLSYHRKALERDKRLLSEKAWRFYNELPTFLLIIIVFCVVLKPFS